MSYVRSSSLNRALSSDGQPLDDAALVSDRQNLVDQFNAAMGAPGHVVDAVQKDFVAGRMPYDDMISYVRFCEYMIASGPAREPLTPSA